MAGTTPCFGRRAGSPGRNPGRVGSLKGQKKREPPGSRSEPLIVLSKSKSQVQVGTPECLRGQKKYVEPRAFEATKSRSEPPSVRTVETNMRNPKILGRGDGPTSKVQVGTPGCLHCRDKSVAPPERLRRREAQKKSKNRRVQVGTPECWGRPDKSGEQKGLISADRSNKATLLLTIPCSKIKSSAKDFPANICLS